MRRHDLDDVGSSGRQELVTAVSQIDKKWSTLHACAKDYRDSLARINAFHKLCEEIELWTSQRRHSTQRLLSNRSELLESFTSTREVEHVLNQIEHTSTEVASYSETKLKQLTQLAGQIYGEEYHERCVEITRVVENLVTELRTETETLKTNLIERARAASQTPRTTLNSQVYSEPPLVDEPDNMPPQFKKRVESAIVFTGATHKFDCVVEGARPLAIAWLQDGREIVADSAAGRLVHVDEAAGLTSLTLVEASATRDTGLFSCRAVNEFGTAETSGHLKVKERVVAGPRVGSAPLIVTPLESVQLNAASDYTLECVVSGEPEPVVGWFKDGVEIVGCESDDFKVGRFMNVRQLTIVNAMPELHTGTYTCRARNEYGEADCSCWILVRSEWKNYRLFIVLALGQTRSDCFLSLLKSFFFKYFFGYLILDLN
jgi:hypothetical protein